jgi:replication-associated recombination protein RarA
VDLFTHASHEAPTNIPLAEKLRPQQLSEILGQEAFLKKYKARISAYNKTDSKKE